jgi:nucleoside-diphosphate-sugar epimerase
MKVFMTGATGYVGAAIARELGNAGASVIALFRSEAKARSLAAFGVVPLRGDLDDLSAHAEGIAGADVIIHAAFDESRGEASDIAATRALLAAARSRPAVAGAPRAFIYTSSAYNLRTTRGAPPVDESVDAMSVAAPAGRWQIELEKEVLAAGQDDLATSVLRLGFVYGGLGGTMPDLFEAARAHGASFYVGSGDARASLIHRGDAARLYRAIAEQRGRGIFHGVDSAPITARDLAAAIAEALACPGGVRRVEPGEAPTELGEHTRAILERDVAVIGRRAQTLGWHPRFEQLERGARVAYEEWCAEVAAKRSS